MMFNCPIENARLTSPFGYRTIEGKREFHQGADLASTGNVPIYASADGVVSRVGVLSTYGNIVMIKHVINGKSYETNHAHLKSYCVKVGQRVKQGEQIGVMGNTGRSYGIHLHYEIHQPAYAPSQPHAKNPMDYIRLNSCVPYKPTINTSKKYNLGYDAPKNSKAYRLHTTAFKTKADANKGLSNLLAKKLLAYGEVFGNEKDKWRIQSGKYLTQKDAEKAAMKLIDSGLFDYISIIGRPE